MADASIAAARANAAGRPPLVEMCAPRRSPGASGKDKRVMLECGGLPPPSERGGVDRYSTEEGGGKPPHFTSLQSEIHRHRVIHIDRLTAICGGPKSPLRHRLARRLAEPVRQIL